MNMYKKYAQLNLKLPNVYSILHHHMYISQKSFRLSELVEIRRIN